MSTSTLQMCREGNHSRINIFKRAPQKYFKPKTTVHPETLLKIGLMQIRRKNILWVSSWILPQKNPTTFLFSVPILLEPWTREFLLHQIWSCITISGTLTLYLLWLCLHSSLLLSPALWQTLILCIVTAKYFSFCDSPLLMGLRMVLRNSERNKILSSTSNKMLKTIAFLHYICLQQCLKFVLKLVMIVL